MEKGQQVIIEELWDALLELSGDIIALETFCRDGRDCSKHYGTHVCKAYMQRMEDYIRQHLGEIEQMAGYLLQDGRSLSCGDR